MIYSIEMEHSLIIEVSKYACTIRAATMHLLLRSPCTIRAVNVPDSRRHIHVSEDIVDAALILRREVPTRSVADLIRILELEGKIPCGQVKRSTLQDHLEKRGYGARQIAMYHTGSAGASWRFERTGRNELWQADIKYLLVLPATAKRPALQLYTSVFIDDATRLVTGLLFQW